MGKKNNPHQDDRDDDGIPDDSQSRAKVDTGQDVDGDGVPDGESIESNPIIINR